MLYISAGPRVSRLSGPGYQTRDVVAEFETDVGGLTVHPDGRLIACIAGRGLAAVDGRGRQSWLNQVEDQPLNCLTSVAATADGNIFVSEGSQLNTAVEWRRDLMQKNRAGRIIVCGPGFESPKVVIRNLPYPYGLAFSRDERFLWLTESWSHRVCRAAVMGRDLGAVEPIIRNLPGYPARLGRAVGGGFWLSLFALRTHLIEFVLREDDFREEMMRTIAPQYWIAPALATSGDALEPMQSGSIKALGIQKPWAPPAPTASSRGSTRMVTSSRACIAASAATAMASPRLAKQRKVSSSSPKGTEGRYYTRQGRSHERRRKADARRRQGGVRR